jgi:hypothetical protein
MVASSVAWCKDVSDVSGLRGCRGIIFVYILCCIYIATHALARAWPSVNLLVHTRSLFSHKRILPWSGGAVYNSPAVGPALAQPVNILKLPIPYVAVPEAAGRSTKALVTRHLEVTSCGAVDSPRVTRASRKSLSNQGMLEVIFEGRYPGSEMHGKVVGKGGYPGSLMHVKCIAEAEFCWIICLIGGRIPSSSFSIPSLCCHLRFVDRSFIAWILDGCQREIWVLGDFILLERDFY